MKIIFITSHVEYAIDAFELSIFRYVPKNDIARRLPGAICDAIRLIELEEGQFYTIQTNSRLEKIPYKEILFLSRDGKTPASPPLAARPGSARAYSRSMRSWPQRNLSSSTGAASST